MKTKRKLDEELDIKGNYTIKTIGLINDDSEDVSRVHIRILELAEDGEVTVTVSLPVNG